MYVRNFFILFLLILTCGCNPIRRCSLEDILSGISMDYGVTASKDSILRSIDFCSQLNATYVSNDVGFDTTINGNRKYRCHDSLIGFEEIRLDYNYHRFMPENIEGPWTAGVAIPKITINYELDKKVNKNRHQKKFAEHFRIYQPDSGYFVLFSSNVWNQHTSDYNNIRYFSSAKDYVAILSPSLYGYERGIRLLWSRYRSGLFWSLSADVRTEISVKDEELREKEVYGLGKAYYKVRTEYIRPLLKEDLLNGGEIYKSYFELILWEPFRPQKFTIIDNRGKIRKMKFYSAEKSRHYKVKFNIDYPFCFKVKKKIIPSLSYNH